MKPYELDYVFVPFLLIVAFLHEHDDRLATDTVLMSRCLGEERAFDATRPRREIESLRV